MWIAIGIVLVATILVYGAFCLAGQISQDEDLEELWNELHRGQPGERANADRS